MERTTSRGSAENDGVPTWPEKEFGRMGF